MTDATLLRPGDHGAAVTALQQRLTTNGYRTAADGWYGPTTEAAVRAFQRVHGLVVDGIAGARTCAALIGQFNPRALTEADIARAADSLAVDPAAIHAVIEVESPRGGFLPDGRVVILFERHVFWQQLIASGIDPAATGLPGDILSQQRGGYVGGSAEYIRLARAQAVASEPAMASCSWGRFQIMGYHAQALGYTSASALATAFGTGEGAQLDAFVQFVGRDDALLKALRGKKWTAFAKIYNGPAYADNAYDARLAAAYKRHSAAALPVAA